MNKKIMKRSVVVEDEQDQDQEEHQLLEMNKWIRRNNNCERLKSQRNDEQKDEENNNCERFEPWREDEPKGSPTKE